MNTNKSKKMLVALEAIVSLETLSVFLTKQSNAQQLNTGSFKLANVAIESICSNTNIKSKKLSFSFEGFDTADTLQTGLLDIFDKVKQLWASIEEDLKSTLTTICDNMSDFKSKVSGLEAELVELETLVNSKVGLTPNDDVLLTPEGWMDCLFNSKQEIPQFGKYITNDVDDMLRAHCEGFKSVIGQQVAWLHENAPKLCNNVNVFYQGIPGVGDLLKLECSRDVASDAERGIRYIGKELPGQKCLVLTVPADDANGEQASVSLSKINCDIDCVKGYSSGKRVHVMWSTKSCLARIEDLKVSIDTLKYWYQVIYGDVWKDQQYQVMLTQTMMTEECSNAGARQLKLYVMELFNLMLVSTVQVDAYAIETYGAVIGYIKASMAKYH